MSIKETKAALETVLNAITPPLDTAWENSAFVPQDGVPYQKVTHSRAQPYTPTMDRFRQELGFMQVTLFYPLDKGGADAETRAALIRDTFEKGNRYTNGGFTIMIYTSPYIMSGSRDEDRWMVPVRIPYFVNVS